MARPRPVPLSLALVVGVVLERGEAGHFGEGPGHLIEAVFSQLFAQVTGQVGHLTLTDEAFYTRGAERFSKRHGVPVVCFPATLEAMDRSPAHLAEWHALPEEGPMDLGSIQLPI